MHSGITTRDALSCADGCAGDCLRIAHTHIHVYVSSNVVFFFSVWVWNYGGESTRIASHTTSSALHAHPAHWAFTIARLVVARRRSALLGRHRFTSNMYTHTTYISYVCVHYVYYWFQARTLACVHITPHTFATAIAIETSAMLMKGDTAAMTTGPMMKMMLYPLAFLYEQLILCV